jgi:hypothetical protein
MAGDWIKMRTDLLTHPKVDRLCGVLNQDILYVVGALFAFWSWADKHSVDGRVDGATSRLVDRVTHTDGLADALSNIGWLSIDDRGIAIPEFAEHNGDSAKERSLKNQRQARWRERKASGLVDANASTNASTSASTYAPTGASTREEKRREEKRKERKDSSPTSVGGFAEFWAEYPRAEGKKPALAVWKSKCLSAQAAEILADVQRRKAQHRAWREGYIPHAQKYLRNELWTDAIDSTAPRIAAAAKPLPEDDLNVPDFDWRRTG